MAAAVGLIAAVVTLLGADERSRRLGAGPASLPQPFAGTCSVWSPQLDVCCVEVRHGPSLRSHSLSVAWASPEATWCSKVFSGWYAVEHAPAGALQGGHSLQIYRFVLGFPVFISLNQGNSFFRLNLAQNPR